MSTKSRPWVPYPFGTIRGPSNRLAPRRGLEYAISLADGSWGYVFDADPTMALVKARKEQAAVFEAVRARGVTYAMLHTKPLGARIKFKSPIPGSPDVDGEVSDTEDTCFVVRQHNGSPSVIVHCVGHEYVLDDKLETDYEKTPSATMCRLAGMQRQHIFLERLLVDMPTEYPHRFEARIGDAPVENILGVPYDTLSLPVTLDGRQVGVAVLHDNGTAIIHVDAETRAKIQEKAAIGCSVDQPKKD